MQVVHASPGRLRLKVPHEALESAAVLRATEALIAMSGIREVSKNPLTGSVLIQFDPNITGLPQMWAAVAGTGINLSMPQQNGSNGATRPIIGEAIMSFFGRADQRLSEMTGGAADLRTVVPIGLVVLAAREVLAGRLGAAPWYTLLWYAYSSFDKLQEHKPSGDSS